MWENDLNTVSKAHRQPHRSEIHLVACSRLTKKVAYQHEKGKGNFIEFKIKVGQEHTIRDEQYGH